MSTFVPSQPSQRIGSGLVLGVDLGSGSLGTALVNREAQSIEFLGVRVFPAGVEGDIEQGKEESRSAKRRQARLARRQTQRRHRRLYRVFRLLQRMGLLPAGPRIEVLPALDTEFKARYPDTTVLPWFLRARALDHRLEPYELGRALYHLAQRRGFLSNRVNVGKDNDEDRSKVKGAIKGLQAAIHESGKRTLAEYMMSLDPHRTPFRNKPEWANHYTHRTMFQHEFALIWDSQRQYHPDVLSDHWRDKLSYAIFHQRPLKDQSHLIGPCELEPEEKRAPLRLLAAQHFRVLGFVNNLRLRLQDGTERKLSPNERFTLLDLCEKSERLSFAAARRALGLARTSRFTIEDGGEKNVPVNLTASRLRAALGVWWDDLSPKQQADLVEDVGDPHRFATDEDLEVCMMQKWNLPAEVAEAVARVRLPDGYARYSLKALREILPALENGLTAEEAIRRHEKYARSRKPVEALSLLPPVKDPCVSKILGDIRNPAVLRALTELRKTVNAIIRRYGKPECIRIELARDLKKSKNERQGEAARNRKREELRKLAQDELRKHDPVRFANPRGADIEKCLLAMEAKWRCPYTGKTYGFVDVFGEHPTVDVEHIIPRSRCLDDSYLNKTLAYRHCNTEKGNRTPREWLFEADHDRYERMIEIVKAFDPRFEVGKKLKRFSMDLSDPDSLLREFTERQLQDTRYASKLACRYLGLLYGGVIDGWGVQRVFASAGQITAKLRRAWDLDRILAGEPHKSRADHRHHAIDALVVALSSPKLIADLARASAEADRIFRRKVTLPFPWADFGELTRSILEQVQVSHRPMRKLSGPLHEETLYSRPRMHQVGTTANGRPKEKRVVHYRVPVSSLKAKDFANIVDSKVREAVERKAAELGGGGTKFLNLWPMLITRKGGCMPIKRVRIRKVESVVEIGHGPSKRYVIPGSNHHAEIVAEMDGSGRILRYRCHTVTLLEALERRRQGVPVVQRDHGPGCVFVCSLSEGDLVKARRPEDAQAHIWKVRSVRQAGQLDLTPSRDARLKKDIADDGMSWRPRVNPLFLGGARKVLVTHLGEVIPAND